MSILASIALSAVIAAGTAQSTTLDNPAQPYPACVTEDSAGPCIWIASVRGNGRGRSFVVTAEQKVIYLDGKPAPYGLPDYEPSDGDGSQTNEAQR